MLSILQDARGWSTVFRGGVRAQRAPLTEPSVAGRSVSNGGSDAGALVAGWLGKTIGWYDTNEGAGFIAAIVGAFILLGIYRVIAGRRRV